MMLKPTCKSCPCYVPPSSSEKLTGKKAPEGSCTLDPKWIPIAFPESHHCSHHPSWNTYLDDQKRQATFSQSIQIPNCDCVVIGIQHYLPPLSQLHEVGMTPYVAMTDCEKCHGSGRIPGKPARKF